MCCHPVRSFNHRCHHGGKHPWLCGRSDSCRGFYGRRGGSVDAWEVDRGLDDFWEIEIGCVASAKHRYFHIITGLQELYSCICFFFTADVFVYSRSSILILFTICSDCKKGRHDLLGNNGCAMNTYCFLRVCIHTFVLSGRERGDCCKSSD